MGVRLPRLGGRAEAAGAGWTENASTGGQLVPWDELWRARGLILMFALRDLRVRYKQAALGVAWVVIQPVFTVVAFTAVFDRLVDVPSAGLPYPVFALAGLLAWTYLTACISRGSEVLVNTPALVEKVYFPRLIAPLASLLPPLVDLLVGLVLLAGLCLAYGVVPGPQLLLLPVWLALLMLTALGIVCALAALNVRYRDVRQVVTPALQVLLLVSPVAYSYSTVDGTAGLLIALNPVVGALELGRWVLIGADWPGWPLLVSLGSCLVVALGGVLYFQRAQRSFADVI
jgi:ABC-2 type transport system permease protein/lipopolysaccharide transport system permease protein